MSKKEHDDWRAFEMWAFGRSPQHYNTGTMHAWNSLHGDIYFVKASEDISESIKKMRQLFGEISPFQKALLHGDPSMISNAYTESVARNAANAILQKEVNKEDDEMSGGSMDYIYIQVEEQGRKLAKSKIPYRRAFGHHLINVAKALHDVEWVDSCDFDEGDDEFAIRQVVDRSMTLLEAVDMAREAIEELQEELWQAEDQLNGD